MNKNDQIKKMLSYLTKDNYNRQISHIGKGRYNVEYVFNIDNIECKKRDHHSLDIDTEKEKVTWYAWDESHHNGDHYNCAKGDLPFDFVYDKLLSLTKDKMDRDMIKEEELERKKTRDEKISKRVAEMLGNE